MRVTVLGKSPAWQDAGGACSGYLVEADGFTVVLDCGNGVFGKLREHVDYTEVDAVAITHMHADHFFDLFPFAYGLLLTPRQQPVPVGLARNAGPRTSQARRPGGSRGRRCGRSPRPGATRRWSKPGSTSRSTTRTAPSSWGRSRSRFRRGAALRPHVRDRADRGPDGKRATFGADCRPNVELVEFARDTDLLIIEATLPRPERTGTGATQAGGGGGSRQAGRREEGLADARLGRAGRRMGPGRGREGLRSAGGRGV